MFLNANFDNNGLFLGTINKAKEAVNSVNSFSPFEITFKEK